MDKEKQREIGRSVPSQARSFSLNPALASAAGRKGGQNVPPHQRTFSRNPAAASKAGREGGAVRRPKDTSREQ
jgi:general stress protein YciG